MSSVVPALLSALSEPTRGLVHHHLRVVLAPANAVVYYQEDPARTVYFVESGHVRLTHIGEDGSVALYGIVPPRGSFGEISPFDRDGYCDTATTIDAATLVALDVGSLLGATPEERELRDHLAVLLARRHRAQTALSRALYMPSLPGRLAMAILHLLETMGQRITVRGQSVECLGPVVTQRDLGTLARGTRENVNKLLRAWTRDGVLAMEDRHIMVKTRSPLEAIALGD